MRPPVFYSSKLSNTRGSAILISLIVLTLLTVMSTVFFEKLYRFSQASEWVENSNVAYYSALGAIEEALYTGGVNKYTPWNMRSFTVGSNTNTGKSLVAYTGSTTIPAPGKGNSDYDVAKDYNIISLGEPIQLVIPAGVTWTDINFDFRVPVIWGAGTWVSPASSNTGFIIWTLASSWASLFASGETNIFQGYKINTTSKIATYQGTSNSWSIEQFIAFYNNSSYLWASWVNCTNFQCTLKLSLIRPIPLTDGRMMNFLEYKISGFTTAIPSQYITLHSEGYAYGFLRSRDVLFPQITTNTALDFAVLQ